MSETTAPTTPEESAVEEEGAAAVPLSACESIPNEAAVAFLYDLAVPTVVSEQEPDGVYCRFETIDIEGSAGDLGRSRAVTTLKLWDSFEACTSVSEVPEAAEIETPPSPWNYLRVVTWPDKPELIVSVTGYDGDHCISVAAPDISSQPLDHWLEFLGAIAGSL
jgi:hypothetical protein